MSKTGIEFVALRGTPSERGVMPYKGFLPPFHAFVCPYCDQYKLKSETLSDGLRLIFRCQGPECRKLITTTTIRNYVGMSMVKE